MISPLGGKILHRAQRIHGHRQGKLLADKSADEAPAANFAAIFQPAEVDQHVTPARQNALARQQFAEHHAITLQQHVAD